MVDVIHFIKLRWQEKFYDFSSIVESVDDAPWMVGSRL